MSRPDIQRKFDARMAFIFTERIYDDLMLAIQEIRGGEQKQISEVNKCNAADVWNIQ